MDYKKEGHELKRQLSKSANAYHAQGPGPERKRKRKIEDTSPEREFSKLLKPLKPPIVVRR